ncbi:MAG: redoxin domain-containing protein [Planctomycetales bacterium]|nr:redoxin domain-containing protein [Planctomycetales bacterium]
MQPFSTRFAFGSAAITCLFCSIVVIPLGAETPDESEETLAGHSYHGEAFNEGPRQAAYLMQGMGNVSFATSTKNVLAQRFIDQGVAQLHGFWYYEAERSFRQAAVLDPQCAMCYWGMAMANTSNRKRAVEFAEKADQLAKQCSPRERLFIKSVVNYCKEQDEDGKSISKKQRAQQYTHDLEAIVEEYPDDIEAKAFLAVQLYLNSQADLPIVSHVAIDALIQDIFDAAPMHPAHHYRIHLWDRHKAERALASAADCGPSLPGIAHMWHMPGHIYSKLHRYQDAAWQQEASARVDHAHMIRDRVMPDQIHNFAHNNEWFIRNLLNVGRLDDAIALAQNMQELPRHPKYNTLKKGSAKYGRERLLMALTRYRLWPELIEFASTEYLEPTDDPGLQNERLMYLGVANALSGQASNAETTMSDLKAKLATSATELESAREQLDTLSKSSVSATDGTDDEKKAAANRKRKLKELEESTKKLEEAKTQLEKAVASCEAALAAQQADWSVALESFEKSQLADDKLLQAEWLALAGKVDQACELIEKRVKEQPGEVLPVAVEAWIKYQHLGLEASREPFERLRELAAVADLHTPLLDRLKPLAEELGYGREWTIPYIAPNDLGERPDLDSLGPMRWHPYQAPLFDVQQANGQTTSLKDLRGQSQLVIFYLGFGCLHCIEQLHEFSPRAEEFKSQGINILAISTEDLESLNSGLSSYGEPLNIPLHSDAELSAFHAYRCFDDFESQPLHGTFLIDPEGKVLWQDISYEPFTDVDFALSESRRLLSLHGFGNLPSTLVTAKEASR